MAAPPRAGLASFALALACAPDRAPHDDLDVTATATTTTPASSSTSSSDPPTTTGSTGPARPDVGEPVQECDQWIEDCPEGQKCMAASLDGDGFGESRICVPVVPNPAGVGEPCTILGSPFSGRDTCDEHMLCLNFDPDSQEGTCFAKCIGVPEAPSCANPDAVCIISSEEIFILCIPACDPLAQDCPVGQACLLHSNFSTVFTCTVDASGDEGQLFDPCKHSNGCDPGLVCIRPDAAVECDPGAVGCCLPFCDTTIPDACPGLGQQCVPWFEEAPPGQEHIGACVLP